MKTLRIKDICDKGSSNLKQKDVENQNGKYPVFGASGLIGNIDTYHQNKDYIAIVKDGSGIGRVSFMPAFSSVIGTLQYILPKEGFNIKYISYCLQSLDLAHYKQGAAIPHIYFRDYGEYEVNVEENPDDQQRIVYFLDSSFEKIEAIKANAANQLQAAKDMFQAALKELLTPKEGWLEKKLGEIGEVIGGTTPNTNVPEFWNGNNCWISPAELKGNHYLYDSVKKITDLAVKKKNLKLLPIGSVILSSRAPIGKVVINKVPTYCNQGFKCVVCKNELYNEFLYWFFYGNTDYLNSLGTGATFAEISKGTVEKIPIKFPSRSEQQQIAAQLDELSAKIKSLQSNYDQTIILCNDLKQALLKQIFE